MNKKTGVLVLLSIIILAQLALAQFDTGQIEDFADKANQASPDKAESYLAQEWTKLIRESPKTAWLYKASPVFKFLIGYEFSISWAFVIAFLIWTVFFGFLYPLIKYAFKETFISLAITIVIISIFSQISMPSIVSTIEDDVRNIWANMVTILLIIFILLFVNRLSKTIVHKYGKKAQEDKISKVQKEEEKNTQVRKEYEKIRDSAKDMDKGAAP